MTSRDPYRRNSTPFKRPLCPDIRAGIIGRRDAQRSHNISANIFQLWLPQFDRGALTNAEAEASVIAEYEARIAALERKVGQLTMELDLAKKHRGCRRDFGASGCQAAYSSNAPGGADPGHGRTRRRSLRTAPSSGRKGTARFRSMGGNVVHQRR